MMWSPAGLVPKVKGIFGNLKQPKAGKDPVRTPFDYMNL